MAYTRFIDKLCAKRMARKSSSGLWIKIPKFTEDRTIQIIHRRTKIRKINKHISNWKRPWGSTHIDKPVKMFKFFKIYNRRKERVQYGKSRLRKI
jgi:hypothetical protein